MTNYGAKDRPASPDGIAKTPMDKSDILYCKDLRFKPTT